MAKPVLSKEELRAQLEAALANYHGPVTHCPPAPRPEPEPEELDLDDDARECETADALRDRRQPGEDRRCVYRVV